LRIPKRTRNGFPEQLELRWGGGAIPKGKTARGGHLQYKKRGHRNEVLRPKKGGKMGGDPTPSMNSGESRERLRTVESGKSLRVGGERNGGVPFGFFSLVHKEKKTRPHFK